MAGASSSTIRSVPILFGVPLIPRQEEEEEVIRVVDDELMAASTARVPIVFGAPLITRQQQEEQVVRVVDLPQHQVINPTESESESSRQKMFPCKHCDLEFDNAQALGGHQNAHRPSPTGLCLLCMNQAPLALAIDRAVADSQIAQVRAQKRRKLAADEEDAAADQSRLSHAQANEGSHRANEAVEQQNARGTST